MSCAKVEPGSTRVRLSRTPKNVVSDTACRVGNRTEYSLFTDIFSVGRRAPNRVYSLPTETGCARQKLVENVVSVADFVVSDGSILGP